MKTRNSNELIDPLTKDENNLLKGGFKNVVTIPKGIDYDTNNNCHGSNEDNNWRIRYKHQLL